MVKKTAEAVLKLLYIFNYKFSLAHNTKKHSMRKITFLLFSLFLFGTVSKAQTTIVKGKLMDTTNQKPVANAVVALLTPKDSIFHKFTRSGADGSFSIKNVTPGKYILMITQPVFADYVDDITATDAETNVGTISATPKSKLLQEVIVKAGGSMRIKGDTVSYTADSFKVSANANVEELLKKLPGIQVDRNGQIKAMGEVVEKVLVDGEEFFGDDPGMAVKNLRADAVKEVQVFDKKSDQAEFTGIDDGVKKKTINLKMKENKKKGHFGKIELAGGLQNDIDNRYNNNILLNSFRGKRKLAGYLLQGNTGQDGISFQDQQKFGTEDENMVGMGMDEDGNVSFNFARGSDEDPYVDPQNGFFENFNVGLQYTNKWNERQNLNFSPKFNRQQYSNIQNNISQLQFGDSTYNNTAVQNTFSYKRSFKNNLVYDVKLDSVGNNSLKITTKANFYNNRSTVDRMSENRSKAGLLNNSSNQLTEASSDRFAFTNSVLYRHRFKKDRRTLSLNVDLNLMDTKANSSLLANNLLNLGGGVTFAQLIDQQKENNSITKKINSKAIYTEPLGKKYSLELNYEFAFTKGESINNTMSQSVPGSGKYDLLVDSLTNNFDQEIFTHKTGFRISYKHKKIKYGFGTGAGFTQFDLKDLTNRVDYKREFVNIFPSATFNYTYKANHAINFTYNGRTIQPSITQLQQLRNNNNTISEIIGNPLLKQAFRHTFNANHSTYDFAKDKWTFKTVNVDFTNNAITNSVIIDPTSGRTVSQPINTNGNVNLTSWLGMGKKLRKLALNSSISLGTNYNRSINYVNNVKNINNNFGTMLSIGLQKSKDKKYDLALRNDLAYNINKATVSTRDKITYITNSIIFDGGVYYKKVWHLTTDITYNYRQQTEDFNQNVNNTNWNARLDRSFKKDEFTVFASMRDILRQNIGVDRSLNANGFSEIRNQRLQQYWLVGVRWDFKNKTKKATK